DRALDYQQNAQIAQRLLAPQATMDSRHQAGLEIAAALDAQFARQLAEKALYTAWMERSSWRAAAGWRWLALEPTDVVTLALADGTQVRGRLTTVNLRGDLSIELALTAEEPAQYDSVAVAEPGLGLPQQTVRGTSATRLILLDLPLLRDSDDTGRSASRLYYAMAGWGDPVWPGALLYKSADASLFDQVGQAVAEAAWGICATTLPDTDRPFATDETTRLRVVMATGAERLESVTQLQMLNGTNAAAVVKPNGEIELIQYRDVAVNDDGSFTLSGLLRGRRGTDTMTNGHVAGELFVLLEPGVGGSTLLALGEIGARRWWKGVGFGQLFEAADLVPFTATGRDLRPYAPWAVRAIKTGSPPDIALSWVRRTRLGGELRDGTGIVPLNEDSEAYEVDILSGPAGTVLRTLSSTGPSVLYANADILADFGAVPTRLTVSVCQLSAQVGRGFARTVTLEIA
ncbi:MAG: hypothetical protein IRY94_19185, partial [Rhodospirillaceae bacterium]|nr:hypothetical protein [Rhodospirillaceae bacterium]